jgi:hypothetical protein
MQNQQQHAPGVVRETYYGSIEDGPAPMESDERLRLLVDQTYRRASEYRISSKQRSSLDIGLNASLLDEDGGWSAIEMAALLIYDGFAGVGRTLMPRMTKLSRRCHLILTHLQRAPLVIVSALMLLTFFERPRWCLARPDECAASTANSGFPLSGVSFISLRHGRDIEWACLSMLIVLMVTSSIAYTMKATIYAIQAVTLSAYVADLVLAEVTPDVGWRLAPYLRPLLLVCHFRPLQRQLLLLKRIVPELAHIGVVVLAFITFIAFYGTIVFDGHEHETYFPTFLASCWSVLVMLTTANWPDVMIYAVTKNRTSCIFFVITMAIGVFFLINLVLASVLNKYLEEHQRQVERLVGVRARNTEAAFRLLDPNGTDSVSTDVMVNLFHEVNRYSGLTSEIETHSREQTLLMFELMDQDQSDGISGQEFDQIMALLQLKLNHREEKTWVEIWFPATWRSSWFQLLSGTVKSRSFELCIDVVICVNAVLVFLQSYQELDGGEDGSHTKFVLLNGWENAEAVLTSIYLLEMILKMTVYGTRQYLRTYRNIFDCTITVLCCIATVVVYIPSNKVTTGVTYLLPCF